MRLKLRRRFWYSAFPKVVDVLTRLSVRKASKELQSGGKVNLLVDNTVLSHAVTHDTGSVSTGEKPWGGITVDTGYAARIPVHSEFDHREAARSVRYLPGIANLAKRGFISLSVSDELKDEQLSQPIGRFKGYGIFDLSLFDDVPIKILRDPEYTVVIGPSRPGVSSVREQKRRRLQNKADRLYQSLVEVLGKKNSQDAWHIATAEKNNCYCFLTMDFALIRNVRSQSGNKAIRSLTTKLMTPEEFGKAFKMVPVPPRICSYHYADYPVEHDTNWPESERKKRQRDGDQER